MRFRSSSFGQAIVWVAVGALQISVAIDTMHRHAVSGKGIRIHDVASTALWALVMLLWGYQLFFSRLELLPDTLQIRTGFAAKTISYTSIVAIRPALTDGGKRVLKTVELEVAALSPAIYPHSYLRIAASDTQAFAEALHKCVPQAVFEPV